MKKLLIQELAKFIGHITLYILSWHTQILQNPPQKKQQNWSNSAGHATPPSNTNTTPTRALAEARQQRRYAREFDDRLGDLARGGRKAEQGTKDVTPGTT